MKSLVTASVLGTGCLHRGLFFVVFGPGNGSLSATNVVVVVVVVIVLVVVIRFSIS